MAKSYETFEVWFDDFCSLARAKKCSEEFIEHQKQNQEWWRELWGDGESPEDALQQELDIAAENK